MTQNVPLGHEDILTESFTDTIQELLGAAAPNFRVVVLNSTTLKIEAGTENSQVSIAIQGRYRWRTTETTAALPGGLPNGEHPVFVTASDNDFSGPINDPDAPTVYTFGLEIKETGKTPATALYRRVGTVTVTAGAITGFEQTVASVSGAQINKGALSSEAASDIEWTRAANGGLVGQYKAESVGTNDIALLAITAARLANEAVETGKMANLAVTEAKLANEGVATGKIKNLAVTAAKIANEAVGTGQVAALAITAAKLAAEAVETGKIKGEAVTLPKLAKTAKPLTWYTPSVIATEETRTNVAYGTLTTPDQITGITIVAGQILCVSFAALWRQSISLKARAAFFLTREGIGTTQTRMLKEGADEGVTSAAMFEGAGATAWANLLSGPIGLQSTGVESGTPASRMPSGGYLLGAAMSTSFVHEVNGAEKKMMSPKEGSSMFGGFAVFHGLVAGTYTVDVRIKSAEGSVTAKERRLQAFVVGPE